MKRTTLILSIAALGLLASACTPPNPGSSGLYLGKQANIHPVVTPKDKPVTWGSAPPIDEHYGGTLYEGTAAEMPDPRPALLPNGEEPLRMWVADPRNGKKGRPAIVWLHGGGFAVGIDSMFGLANGTAKEYAQRGYVGFSVEYRTDTTLKGKGSATQRPPSLCQWVQDHMDMEGQPEYESARDQCERNILAAQRDVQGAVRWIRAHAGSLGVDPTKIAVGGFSAGAVTSLNLAYRSEDVGGHRYFASDQLSVENSKVQAALSASGCYFTPEDGVNEIGPGDAPSSGIASKGDQAVSYACTAQTTVTARRAGLVAELTSYCNESTHGAALYRKYQTPTDEQWTTFLARHLKLYTGMRQPSTAPVCR